MAINEELNKRIRHALSDIPDVEEKKMFRGIAFMVDGKMCVSAGDHEIMCRIDPALHEEMAAKPGCRPMERNGTPYRGYIYVHDDYLNSDAQLNFWIKLCLDFNKFAKASKKKNK